MNFRFKILLLALFLFTHEAKAFHIIGGEIYYSCTGNNNYTITMIVYRDCSNLNAAPFDNPASIAIYNADQTLYQALDVYYDSYTAVQPDLSNPCLIAPPGVCVEQAIYQATIFLPSASGGYDISYQRCCRNTSVVNIIAPENTGATYSIHIPGSSLATCNTSPHFSNYPPIVICANENLIFDHSATEPDGDVLRYSLCTPNQGADQTSPQPIPPPPPPYDPIFWNPPYNVNDQIGGIPPMAIDSITGLLTGKPSNVGQYVVGVCVREYRNGNLLCTNTRDFQFNVADCDPLIIADFSSPQSVNLNADTLTLCGTLTVNFDNNSFGASGYEWDFGVAGISTDVSDLQTPSYTYPDTGIYKVRLIASPGLLCGDTAYKYVELRLGVDPDFSTQNVCVGSPSLFFDQSIALDGNLTSWQWNFGDGGSSSLQNPIHNYFAQGNYNVTLTSSNSYGCYSFITKTITVYALPNIAAAPDTFICNVDSVMLIAHDGVSYSWQPNYNISSTSISNPVVSPDVTTTYYVTVVSDKGCINSDSVTVKITDTVLAVAGPDTTICEGQLVQLYAMNAVYYQWFPDDNMNNAFISNPVVKPDVTTTYFVNAFIGSCVDQDTVTVTVLPLPPANAGEDVTINQGESTRLNASGGGIYQWIPPDALTNAFISDPNANPINTITYALIVTGDNGCVAFDSVTVFVTHIHDVLAPNAFTPNGDGINDYFQFFLKGISLITSVKIFDRWGEMVYYSATNEVKGWNGTYKELDCEMDTYVYSITGITYDGDEIRVSGSLTLIR
ncbi:MAG: gliding motility-associated C-terminal domain-containing protein [Chitinophagales bacterium]|nr:gliding motility-associated C-terminal domain-containing protein [Chitinophagales bacterium]